MPMMDYVIGGMDRSFKLKLFQHAALRRVAAGAFARHRQRIP